MSLPPDLPRPHAVGFVGLGVMGAPMAGHILRAGHRLHVTARRPESAAALVGAGATWHPTARELAGRVDVVVLMLPDLPDIEALLAGAEGLLAGVAEPLRVVISSTVSPAGVRALDARVRAETGGLARLVDAPVSGGEEGAVAGTLSVMVGGQADDVAPALAVLAATGRAVHLGPLGAGQVAKACNQLIVAATVLALGEASVIAERAGLDVAAMLDLLGGGYAASRILEVKKTRFAEHDHSPSGPAKFMVKDLRFAADEARLTGTATPQLDVLRDVFTALTAAGLGDQDTAVVQAYLEGLTRRES
ncbi:NAD(P)-dependent oxidoreductase [Pengzhenrongella sicca]|uniref:NAD(P)-dependent oxidoreductase n=1 Tax=Pengzhenrongella sicca TaxID=2819238 RepID=A0A8A4ZAU1_9MICO|nr:NAD(P)-dependent oxidoreductase [Pengzhenrongella sicca]QTE28003.1 NAD(P)-dependent oxidoreductase [Pengzhenrongella sicca]